MQKRARHRRDIFNRLALGVAITGALSACRANPQSLDTNVQSAQPYVKWRMATSWPEELNIRFASAQMLCDRIHELTNGNFSITPFPSGGIAPPLKILDTVQLGSVECGYTTGFYYIDKSPAFALATSMPFGLTAGQHLAWLYGGDGLALLRGLYADFNAINFPMTTTGPQMGGWFKQELTSLSDLEGLRIRMPGLGGEVLKRLGAEVKNLPPNELLIALSQNELDAAEWTGPYDDEKLGLHKVAPFYYYPGWHEPGTIQELLINQSAWEKLPQNYQEAIQTATFETFTTMLAQYDVINYEALQRLLNSGTKLVAYPRDILSEAAKVATDLYVEFASQDARFREIFENWNGFRRRIYQWNRVNQQNFSELLLDNS